MAGRIRTIKPEILDDEKSASLSSDAWRLWVSMWLLADDYGRVRGDSRRLAASVFWAAPKKVDIDSLLHELMAKAMVTPYRVRDQIYLEIANWTKHQRIDNASSRGKLPDPSEADNPYLPVLAAALRESPQLAAPRGSDLEGNRKGIGREGIGVAAKAAAVAVLDLLNQARKQAIPGSRTLAPIAANLLHIEARLADGYTVEDCQHVITVRAAEVRQKPETAKWFNTVTPFLKDSFARGLGGDPDSVASGGHARAATYGAIEAEGDMTHLLGEYMAKP